MSIVIETCPHCGNDLQNLVLTVNPPIPEKYCFRCGWRWVGSPQKVIRVPFGGNTQIVDEEYLSTMTVLNNVDGQSATIAINKSQINTASVDGEVHYEY